MGDDFVGTCCAFVLSSRDSSPSMVSSASSSSAPTVVQRPVRGLTLAGRPVTMASCVRIRRWYCLVLVALTNASTP